MSDIEIVWGTELHDRVIREAVLGAGLGARKAGRRNLELGAVTRDTGAVARIERLFDSFWMGAFCGDCAFRQRCPDPI